MSARNGSGLGLLLVGAAAGAVGLGVWARRAAADDDDDDEAFEDLDDADDRGDAAATATTPAAAPAGDTRRAAPRVPPLPAEAPRGRLTRSTDHRTHVTPSDGVLLEQARRSLRDPRLTMDELAAARLGASEHDSGTLIELACMVDAELNRAERNRRSLYESLTRGTGFGRQKGRRPASTARDPAFRHLWAARAVLSGPARGISRGATRFFDPRTMDVLNAKWKAGRTSIVTTCDALELLELWSFDRPRRGRSGCPYDKTKTGSQTQAWVGPIEGVDAWRLMLMRPEPMGPLHLSRYMAAAALITTHRGERKKGR